MAIRGKKVYLGGSPITLFMDEGIVAIDPSQEAPVSYLFDTYPGTAGFSVRKLKTAATASFRVKRSSDNTEQDVGFDSNGNLDTGSLLSFVGANNGTVVTWYDQSGNGHDTPAVAGAADIVVGGSVLTTNGIPSLRFDNAEAYTTSNIVTGESAKTIFAVYKPDSVDINNRVFELSSQPSAGAGWQLTTEPAIRTNTYTYITTVGTTNQQLMNIVQSGSAMQTDFDMYIDGTHVPASSGTSGTLSGANGNFSIGYGANGSNYFDGTYQELIIYNSQLSGADREAVETEINNYYSIYV